MKFRGKLIFNFNKKNKIILLYEKLMAVFFKTPHLGDISITLVNRCVLKNTVISFENFYFKLISPVLKKVC